MSRFIRDAKAFVLDSKKEHLFIWSAVISAIIAALILGVFARVAYAATCPALTYNLTLGHTDAQTYGEVSILQTFLAQYPDIYPEGDVVGYFGAATDAAVKRWQDANNILGPGDIGYGVVGLATRESIKQACFADNPDEILAAQMEVAEPQESAPLKRSISYSLYGSNCASYAIDWGDDSNPAVQIAPDPEAECDNKVINIKSTHTYVQAGAYVVTLYAKQHATNPNEMLIVDQIRLIVEGENAPGRQARMSVSPSSGRAPLDITASIDAESQLLCTAYSIDWGDGSEVNSYDPGLYNENCYGGAFSRAFTHTYEDEGAYTIRAKAGPASLDNLEEMNVTISVYDAGWAPEGDDEDNIQCFIDPRKGTAPFNTAAFVPLGGAYCDGDLEYYVDWGDGFRTESRYCDDAANHYDIFYHQYDTDGAFDAQLVRTHGTTEFTPEECPVEVRKPVEIEFTIPQGGDRVIIDKPFTLKWTLANAPGKQDGKDPRVRLTFITEDGRSGFIADVDVDDHQYEWTPTTEPCIEGVCQSSITPGKYYIQASVIYDPCDGDPYCGRNVDVVGYDRIEKPVQVFASGTPALGESWLVQVSDRLFAHPLEGVAPAIIHFTSVLNSTASCQGGVYTIEFGDGTSSAQAYPQGMCRAFASSFSHTYIYPGRYLVTLSQNGIPTASMPITITSSDQTANALGVWNAVVSFFKNLFSKQ
jgi:PKD repeat protein